MVKNVKIGDEVIVSPGLSCGICYECQVGYNNRCKNFDILGLKSKGGYADYVVVPSRNAILKPNNLSFEEALSYPLTFLTAWNALVIKGKIKP
ncbi:MAG: alcohol dehydrogenase catalytic domain-containing protein [Candidatus Bathyarchaeia archaeon]